MAWIPLSEGGYRLGKYRALAHLGAGGMGAVYRAVNEETGEEVALKVLPPDIAARPTAVDRFIREARHGALLRHPHIVGIHDLGQEHGTYFLAMELVDGTDLQRHIQQHGPLTPDETRRILVQIAMALDHAHRLGMVHRDIKPSNILLTRKDERLLAKLTDLGLSRIARDEDFRVTSDGITVGTVDYLAPEQARDSGAADIRSDLYSLGCTLFHMLTGKPPFATGSLAERLFAHAESEAPDPRQFNPDIPEELCLIYRRLLAKIPDERFQTPAELLRAIMRAPEPVASQPTPLAAERGDAKGEKPALAGEDGRRLISAGQDDPRGASGTLGSSEGASQISEIVPDEDPSPASAEQLAVAAGQYERATQVLADDNFEYGLPLLLTCCQLDPTNVTYRAALRQAYRRKRAVAPASRWTAWAKTLGLRRNFKRAKKAGDPLKVLYAGEELLARAPEEVPIHLDMAEAAQACRYYRLALWLLQQAREISPHSIPVTRALALVHEKVGDLPTASSLWEEVQQTDPDNGEAHRKLRDLAAHAVIARGRYRQHLAARNRAAEPSA